MKKISFKRVAASSLLAATAVLGLQSCGGGGNTAAPGDFLPIGSTLKLILNDGNNVGHPYIFALEVIGDNLASIVWESRTTTSGTTAFSIYRSGNMSYFTTSFYYVEGSYIAPGPTLMNTANKAEIRADLTLPEGLSNDSYIRGFSGDCQYTVRMEADPRSSGELTGTYQGYGSYAIGRAQN